MGAIIGILLFGTLSTMGCIGGEEEDMWDNDPHFHIHGEWIEKTENKDYQILFNGVPTNEKPYFSVDNFTFVVYDLNKKDITNGYRKISEVYEKPIDDDNNFSFRDGDHDGYLSIGDIFILKSRDHVDDDGKLSSGPVKPGFCFELRCGPDGKGGGFQLFEKKVK